MPDESGGPGDGPGASREAGGATSDGAEFVDLSLDTPVWERFFTVAPLVVVGTKEADGFDLAPKHMATPVGWRNHFAFVCTPRHATYRNVREHESFTVSFPRPTEVVPASLAATPRDGEEHTPGLEALPTAPARTVEGVWLRDSYAVLECRLERIVDGFEDYGLVVGRIVEARVRRESLRLTERSDADLLLRAPLLAYLSPGRYAKVDESYVFPFPAEFQA